MTKTFAERCKMFEQCLPDASYRDLLKALHTEMLAKLAEQPAPAAQEEPIYQCQDSTGKWTDLTKRYYEDYEKHSSATVRVVYTTPQAQPAREWAGMTDEDVIEISHLALTRVQAARMTEAKLKEKNHD